MTYTYYINLLEAIIDHQKRIAENVENCLLALSYRIRIKENY